ncbi:MAG: S41 family peptidase [Erythrobacter sp.]
MARDGHLRVMFAGAGGGPQVIIMQPRDGAAGPPPGAGQPIMMKMARPPAIEHAGWIAPGIAFVRFNGFPSKPETIEAARKCMTDHAGAKAIIFDLRTHMGGGLGEMDEIFPWLFSQPTHLLTMAARKSVEDAAGSPIADIPSLRIVAGDPNFVTREHWVTPGKNRKLNQAKVFVLTSGFSASAAEHFVLALKHTKRATIVGRATAGANHFGGDQDLGGGFSVFLPVGRAYDPKTGKDWEGVGIAPDIDVPPEEALVMALTMSGVAPDEAKQLSASVAPMIPMMARL